AVRFMGNVKETMFLQFLLAVTEHLLEHWIYCNNPAVKIHESDSDGGVFKNGAPACLAAACIPIQLLHPHDHVVEYLAEACEFIIAFRWNPMAEITLGQCFRASNQATEWLRNTARDH